MLNQVDLEKLSEDLAAITQTGRSYQSDLHNVLQSFQDLLECYTSLKSDYEEEKEGRERYKRQAKARERNPFVLVLIDGDGYLFKEHLIKAGTEGGVKAAQLLSDSIKSLLPPDLADNCRVMVRIYANIFGLSATLARSQLVGREARSFAPFASSFTNAQDLFDFVDAGIKKEGTEYKIRELFRLFVDNHQCKHIFFGGCHDVGYLSMLTPYRGETSRITLLKAANMIPEYEYLDLFTKEIPSVFMSTAIEGSASQPAAPTTKPVCTHFLKGCCKFGLACTKSHVLSEGGSHKFSDSPPRPSSKNSMRVSNFGGSYARLLPKLYLDGRIPVDKDGGRLDLYTPTPSNKAITNYRNQRCRPCNKYHLLGECKDMNCSFDHSFVDPELIDVVSYYMKQRPCLRGRGCRVFKCLYGHHCQIDGCLGSKPCKMNRRMHDVDLHTIRWTEPDEISEDPDDFQASLSGDAEGNGNGDSLVDNQPSRSLSVSEHSMSMPNIYDDVDLIDNHSSDEESSAWPIMAISS